MAQPPSTHKPQMAALTASSCRPSLVSPRTLYRDAVRCPTIRFDTDGPGENSLLGPRHDNDHVYIHNINILPTTDECLSLRPPWLPSKDIGSKHFMPHGYARHLDIHFRLLRYDSTERIRDVNYNAAQHAFLSGKTVAESYQNDFLETTIGNRYFLYRNLKTEDILADEHEGFTFRASFDCPANLKGQKMHKSTRLEQSMLSPIILVDHDTNELLIQYFNIQMRHSTFVLAARNGHEERAAVDLSILPDATSDDIRETLSIAVGTRSNVSMALVEYPKLLYAGFANILHCLQKMSDFDYAFGQYVSPREDAYTYSSRPKLVVEPPSYAKEVDFKFDLQPLTGRADSTFSV